MAWNEFYMQSGGSNLNAGSTTANAAVYTSTAGNWDGTSVFTPTDSSTPASTVSVGHWASIYSTGDTVAGYVAQVTNVAAGANGAITLSTTAKYGTAPGTNSGSRACKTGGAWANFEVSKSPGLLNVAATAPASTRINTKAATYANTGDNPNCNLIGTDIKPVWFRGYKTTPGDQDFNANPAIGTDVPYLTFTTNAFALSRAYQIVSSFAFTSANTGGSTVYLGHDGQLIFRCRVANTAANASAHAVDCEGTGNAVIACNLSATTSAPVVSMRNNSLVIGNVITGGSGGIISADPRLQFIAYNVIDSPAGDAIAMGAGGGSIIGNSIYAPGGNGINFTGMPTTHWVVVNNYFEKVDQAAKAAIMNSSGTDTQYIVAIANAYFNCTANTSGLTEGFTILDNGTLAGPGFVAPGAHNFALNDVARAIGFPGAFTGVTAYSGYFDAGAVQRREPTRYRGRRGN